ncbi:MAG: TfoX/Sxy family protein [Acidobacteriota bacterium]
MAYDEGLAQRLREQLAEHEVVEKKMFGGLAFMLQGHMACGVSGDDLMLRVGPEAHEEALARPHARPMDFTGKPLRGFVYVDAEGFAEDEDLAEWVAMSTRFALSLPPK